MIDIIYAIFSMLLAFAAAIILVAFGRVLRAGPGKVSYLRRKRYGIGAWLTGGLPKTGQGTTLHELEGLELRASGGKLRYIRQTRAPTAEI
jgi:hypothetical protein